MVTVSIIFFSAHLLKLGRNVEWGVVTVVKKTDIHDDMLQIQHRWPQHVGEAGFDILWVPD